MGVGGLGRGDPLWIFFAFVFNAVWEKSTPMPPVKRPRWASRAEEGCFLPQRLDQELGPPPPPPLGQENPDMSSHRPVSSPLLCKVILVVHKI